MTAPPDGVGHLLRRYRIGAEVTQRELARRAGLSVRALRNIEQNRVRTPHPRSVHRLAAALDLPDADRERLLARVDANGRRVDAKDGGVDADGRGARLSVGVLGPLSVRRGDVPVEVGPDKQRRLFGLLAIQAPRVVQFDEIVDVLWGERTPRTCVDLVHTYVARLRTLVEPGRPRRTPAQVVARERGGYRLALGDDEVDVLRFADLAARGQQAQAAGDRDTAGELFAQALQCWRGPVAADLGPPLRAHPAAVEMSRRRLEVALACADIAIERGRHEQVIAYLRALAGDEALHEGLHARLVLALAGTGQRAAALRLYAEIRARLADELGIEPGGELRAAHLRVLRQEPAVVAAEPLVVAAEPPDRRPATPAQLPADVPAFTGRTRHLAELDALLPAGDDRGTAVAIAAICGTAGVGKTALAVHWAHRVRDRFPDGQLHVNLRGHATTPPLRPVEALARLLHALGVPAERVPVAVDEAAGLYRTLVADRRLLVVLDNAGTADQVRPLLPGSPTCLVLLTSRDRLADLVARDGARRLDLDVLAPAEARTLLERLVGRPRVQAEPAAVAALAEACGYLPLALRVAAANLADQPRRTIAAHVADLRHPDHATHAARAASDGASAVLDGGGTLLDGDRPALGGEVPAAGRADRAARAARAAFDLPYGRLPAAARRLFRLQSLVPGPDLSADGAAAVAGVTPAGAARLLDRLTAAHLVEEGTAGRYACHDLLRAYASERARAEDSEDERAAALGRLLDRYLQGVDHAARLLYPEKLRLPVPPPRTRVPPPPFADHAGALAWLDAERPSLVATVAHCAEHGPRPAAWLLSDGLRGYFWLRMHAVDWLATAHAGLAAARYDGDLNGQAAAHLSLGGVHLQQDRPAPAIEHNKAAMTLGRRTGWLAVQAAALGGLAGPYWRSGRTGLAAEHVARALVLQRRIGALAGMATSHSNLCHLYQEMGKLAPAVEHGTQAAALHRRLGSRGGEALVLANLGATYVLLGRLDDARAHAAHAVTLQRQIGSRYGEADALRTLAAAERDAGQHVAALDLAGSALAIARDIGERRLEAEVLNTLASVHRLLGHHRRAADHHHEARQLARETGNRHPETKALLGLAAAEEDLGAYDEAAAAAREALAHARQAGYRLLEGSALTALAGLYLAADRPDLAAAEARRALAIHQETGYRLGVARTHVVLGTATATPAHWHQALAIFVEVGSPGAERVRALLNGHPQP